MSTSTTERFQEWVKGFEKSTRLLHPIDSYNAESIIEATNARTLIYYSFKEEIKMGEVDQNEVYSVVLDYIATFLELFEKRLRIQQSLIEGSIDHVANGSDERDQKVFRDHFGFDFCLDELDKCYSYRSTDTDPRASERYYAGRKFSSLIHHLVVDIIIANREEPIASRMDESLFDFHGKEMTGKDLKSVARVIGDYAGSYSYAED